jgi:AsmA protein
MKILKSALLGAGVLALVLIVALAYLAFSFEPRDYQPRIVQFVKDKTGRTLDIQGGLELSFWPDIGVRLGRVSLSERASTEPFADIDDARFTVKLLPLFSHELVANDIRIRGARIRIIRYADGRLNIDDLFRSEGGALQFDIGRVTVERSDLSYSDLRSGERYELSGIGLETGRLTNGIETPITLMYSAKDAARSFDVGGGVKGRLTFDVRQKTYALNAAAFTMNGRIADSTALELTGNASVDARLNDNAFSATGLAMRLKRVLGDEAVDATLQASKISVVAERMTSEDVVFAVQVSGSAGATNAKLALPRLDNTGDAFTAERVTADLDLDRGGHRFNVAATARMEADWLQRRLVFSELKSNFRASGQRLPKAGVTGTVSGSAAFDALAEGLQLQLSGTVADSRISARLGLANFAMPVYTVAINVDQLDMDRYATGAPAQLDKPSTIGLSSFADLPVTGTVDIGELKAGGVKARNVKLVLKR